MRPITASVTPASPTALVRMDNYAVAAIGGQIVCSGGGSFTLAHSFDDPNDLVNPVPVGSMSWQNGLLPAAARAGSANVSFQATAAPLWFQFTLTSGVGSARATFFQVGDDSYGVPIAGGGAVVTSVWSAADAAANNAA